mgnify:CR=1 FL=1
MKKKIEQIEILKPINQLNLYGYESYFDLFIKLFNKNKIPNRIIFSGAKGLGKATFSYHLINYLLSIKDNAKYSTSNYKIDETSVNYNKVVNNIHPNFFLLDTLKNDNQIKIEQTRDLLKFLNKSTFSQNIKIVLIDNAENLNLNSSNSILKAIEEAEKNTFFFIIHNHSYKILDTIKSRCLNFKIFFNSIEKKEVFQNLANQYNFEYEVNDLNDFFHFDTPGNILNYSMDLVKNNIKIKNNYLNCIFYFFDKYLNEKNSDTLNFISLFVEKFYNDLYINNENLISTYSYNKQKILARMNNMKKFNLSEKNTYIWMKDILLNDAR